MNIKDSTALLSTTTEGESSIEIDKAVGSSSIRAIAINTGVNKAIEQLNDGSDSFGDSHSSLDKSAFEQFALQELDKLVYGFKDGTNYSRKTQTWQGYIIEVNDLKFIGKLEDLSNPGGTHEILEFNLSEVSPDDINLIQNGAIFYWSVGSVMANDQLKGESILRFKRVAKWTGEEYDKAADLANSLYKSINWE